MDLNEKVAYIRGLCDGLKLDENKDEVRVLKAIIDLLDDVALSLTDMEELYDDLSMQVDEIDEDLGDVEEELYGDDGCDCCDDEDDFDDEDEQFYEVTCGKCNNTICVSEDVLLEGEIECPNCGEVLEFDFSDLFDEECGCGCEDCSDEEDLMS